MTEQVSRHVTASRRRVNTETAAVDLLAVLERSQVLYVRGYAERLHELREPTLAATQPAVLVPVNGGGERHSAQLAADIACL